MSVTRAMTSSIASGSPSPSLELAAEEPVKPVHGVEHPLEVAAHRGGYSVFWNRRLRSNSQRLSRPDFSILSRIAMYESRQVSSRRFASRTRDSAVAASTAKTPVAGFLASATSKKRPAALRDAAPSPPMRVSSP